MSNDGDDVKRRKLFKQNRKWAERYLPVLFSIAVFTLLGVFSLNISQDVNKLTKNFDKFYKHSYIVGDAIDEFNLNALEIVSLLSGNNMENLTVADTEFRIKSSFTLIDSLYVIIKDNYLGGNEQTRALSVSYNAFKDYVGSIKVNTAKINHIESDFIELNLLFQDITQKIEPIDNYVNANADDYLSENIIEDDLLLRKLKQLYIVIVVFFGIGLYSTLYLLMRKNGVLFNEKEKFAKAIETAPVPMMIHKNGIIKHISEEWLKLTGYSRDEIPTIEAWCRKAYGDDYKAKMEFIYKKYELETIHEDEMNEVRTKTGKKVLWKFRSGPLGRGYFFSSAIDFTEESNKQHQIESLYDEKIRLAMAVDQSPASILITDVKGKIQYVNNYFTELTGYTLEEVVGKTPSVLKSGVHDTDFYKNLWKTISSGSIWNGELENKAKDGTVFWELASIYPIIDIYGKIINYVAVKENITEKKNTQEALVKSEKKYRDLFSRSTDPCLILKDGVYVDCNNAALKALGMRFKKELIGLKPSQIAPEFQENGTRSDSGSIEKMIKASEDKHLRFEWLHKKVNGDVSPSEVMLTKIEEGDGDYFYVVWRDISARKKYEEGLKESEQKLKAITDNIEGAVHRYIQYEDGKSAINYMSKGAKKLYGLTREEVMSNQSLLWNQIMEEDRDRVIKSLQKSAKDYSSWNCIYQIKAADGAIKWIRGIGTPIRDHENKCTVWDIIVLDVTNYVKLQDKIKQQLDEKTILLAEIHHRVKNNLAIISGLLELQIFSSEDSKVLEVLGLSVQRIKTIAIIHEQIYNSGDFTAISIDESIKSEIENMLKKHNTSGENEINVNYDVESIKLNVNQAIPFGLLINELVTSSVKHSLASIKNPSFEIYLHHKSGFIEFIIQINGVSFDVNDFNSSLVKNLISVFVSQLDGNLDVKSSPKKGTNITLTFKPTLKRGSSSNYDV